MNILIENGCRGCIFAVQNDMDGSYTCRAEEKRIGFEQYHKENKYIKIDKKYQPITPEWCPLMTEIINVIKK